MCLSVWWFLRGERAQSRCLQLHTRLWGGVVSGGVWWFWALGVCGGYGRGLTVRTACGGGGSYNLKEPFLWSVCQSEPRQTQSQVGLVRLAELMRTCTLRRSLWCSGELAPCFFRCLSLFILVPHQKSIRVGWTQSPEADVCSRVPPFWCTL